MSVGWPVYAGSENPLFESPTDELEKGGTLWIPLNGGSETRRILRNYYRDFARSINAEFKGSGCDVEIKSEMDPAALSRRLSAWRRREDELALKEIGK